MRRLAIAVLLVAAHVAGAAPVAELVQRPGALLPLDVALVDETGRAAPLARYFGRAPVVLVLGYYGCPNLCSTLMEGVLQASSAMDLARGSYEIVGVGIDPREGATDAARKAYAYRAVYDHAALHLLTGRAESVAQLAQAAGFRFEYDRELDQYAHPLAFMVVTREGRIARYFPGVRFEPRELRLALVEASAGRIGSLSERIFLRCAHFNPATGRYSFAAMSFVRGGSALVAVALLAWIWRRRARR